MAGKPFEDLSGLTLMEDHLFGAVMQDEALAKTLNCDLYLR